MKKKNRVLISETDNQSEQGRAAATDAHSADLDTPSARMPSANKIDEAHLNAMPSGPDRKDSTQVLNEANPKDQMPPQDPGPIPRRRNPLRTGIGALLFTAWGIMTIIWVASTIHSVMKGDLTAVVTAAAALALLVLLGIMEGLEVSVIDRWQMLWPGESMNYLARWLAARQLFVALIVTAATLLANRSVLIVPGTSAEITDSFTLGVFDLAWTTLTVLWFAQIFPKHLGATNPDRYLERLRRAMFPVVEFVRLMGISQPGEWTADAVEYWLDWPISPEEAMQRRAHKHTLGEIWCELRRPYLRKTQTSGQNRPEHQ